jgi:hypothetical protein
MRELLSCATARVLGAHDDGLIVPGRRPEANASCPAAGRPISWG